CDLRAPERLPHPATPCRAAPRSDHPRRRAKTTRSCGSGFQPVSENATGKMPVPQNHYAPVYGSRRLAVNSLEPERGSIEENLMNYRDAAIRTGLILTLAAGLAGCRDPDIGTIHADRGTIEHLQRAGSDRPAKPTPSGKASRRPDFNDLSPKLRGRET